MRSCRVPLKSAFDTAVAVTAGQAARFFKSGYRTAIRYVDRVKSDPTKDEHWPINLTIQERDILLDAGLCISLAQYFSTRYESTHKGARFSFDHGQDLGTIAAINAQALGAPEGMAIWFDLEDCPEASPAMVANELNGWSTALVRYGLTPCLYVGSGIGSAEVGYTTGDLLWSLPRYRCYWRAASIVPQIPNRGWTMVQGMPVKVHGVEIDQDMPALDHRDYYNGAKERHNVHRFLVMTA